MKILVYGAGVIGCYLAHLLKQTGQDVSLFARGNWKTQLEQKGLVIYHHLQKETTFDRLTIVDSVQGHYDLIFAVMQHQQLWDILDDLAAADCGTIMLVGNNMSASDMKRRIQEKSPTPKTVLFGFQGTGGRRENGSVVCVRMGSGSMTYGGLDEIPKEQRAIIESLFAGTGYRLTWAKNMDAWYKCHLALILPAAYLCYATDCNLRKATHRQRKLLLDAASEAYSLLKALGYPILPEGEDAYYRPGPKRIMMAGMIFLMAKTAIGDLAASDHCRHAVSEMEGLDIAFAAMRAKKPGFPMKAFDTLREAKPAWKTLHQLYEGQTE